MLSRKLKRREILTNFLDVKDQEGRQDEHAIAI